MRGQISVAFLCSLRYTICEDFQGVSVGGNIHGIALEQLAALVMCQITGAAFLFSAFKVLGLSPFLYPLYHYILYMASVYVVIKQLKHQNRKNFTILGILPCRSAFARRPALDLPGLPASVLPAGGW